jgi:hypothetical protein
LEDGELFVFHGMAEICIAAQVVTTGLAVQRTASLPLAYDPVVHAEMPHGLPNQVRQWSPGVTVEISSSVTTGLDPVVHAEMPDGLPDQVRQ